MIRTKKGFTLVELMVVAIIVAILAAVAVPLMKGSKDRAVATEAEAALGSIRSQMRSIFAQYGAYTGDPTDPITDGAVQGNVPGFDAASGSAPGDLDGTYFSGNCYDITVAQYTFTAECDWSDSNNSAGFTPKYGDVDDSANETEINHLGTITRDGY